MLLFDRIHIQKSSCSSTPLCNPKILSNYSCWYKPYEKFWNFSRRFLFRESPYCACSGLDSRMWPRGLVRRRKQTNRMPASVFPWGRTKKQTSCWQITPNEILLSFRQLSFFRHPVILRRAQKGKNRKGEKNWARRFSFWRQKHKFSPEMFALWLDNPFPESTWKSYKWYLAFGKLPAHFRICDFPFFIKLFSYFHDIEKVIFPSQTNSIRFCTRLVNLKLRNFRLILPLRSGLLRF